MSDRMQPISFKQLINWIFTEYGRSRSIFGIPEAKFYRCGDGCLEVFGEKLGTPIGPAAGPHTQLAQNIVAAYLAGGRFFELKTVQILDRLEFPKPCIAAQDECYNTEWSTELAIEEAFAEYVKAWFALHIIQKEIFGLDERDFVFNMSVGYNLEGVKSPKVDAFIEGMKNAAGADVFQECRRVLLEMAGQFKRVDRDYIEAIPSRICSSVTLSTMHGCPPAEIDAICRYLLKEKELNTFVKMNPTLLGYAYVRRVFDQMGYGYVRLKEESFSHDLQYDAGVAMLRGLKAFAADCGREFGVKLSNTLPVQITRGELPGEEMYMSGRSLYPLTINLAFKLASEFDGDLQISYAGGADYFNIDRIFATGIRPLTMATTLLKPGGYYRLQQIAALLAPHPGERREGRIDLKKLGALAADALADRNHRKEKRAVASRKIADTLPLTDCFVAPCTRGCPIGQDIPAYIRLVGEKKYAQAYAVIVDKNPLPFITGTICNHKCMTKCTRLDYDDPVLIREMKLVAAENGCRAYLDELKPAAAGSSDARVAVLGAGPSGLAAAYFLARAGIDVTVFDRRDEAGGTVARVIPDFRISRAAIENDLELIRRTGVKFVLGVKDELTVEQLRAQGFKYVYLAIGAGKSKTLSLPGDAGRVMGAIAFLEQFKRNKEALSPGRNVVVIGGGNSAMDTARAALRVPGVEKVTIVYRRTREYMPALAEELTLAQEEGVVFRELLAPVEFTQGVLRCQKMTMGEPDASGRRVPVPLTGEYEDIPADFVLTAIGEAVDTDYLARLGLRQDERGRITVDPDTLETALAGVFIGGDALSGPATVVEAIADGRKVAGAIAARENLTVPALVAPAAGCEQDDRRYEAEARKGVLCAAGDPAAEPERCLECSLVCNICTEVCPNRANVRIAVSGGGLRQADQVLHIDGMCNECGNCATFCPYTGAPYRDKLTLFWNEADFDSSSGAGFYLLADGAEPVFKVRLHGTVLETKLTAAGFAPALPEAVAAVMESAYTNYRYLFQA